MSLTKETFLENLRRSMPSSSPIPIPEPNESKIRVANPPSGEKGRPKGAKRGSAESKLRELTPKDVHELTPKPLDVTPYGGSLRELVPLPESVATRNTSFEGNYSNMFF